MTNDEARMMTLWTTQGLITEGLGPQVEWSPVTPDTAQKRHQAYWDTVSGIMPDDEHEEPFWMTQAATEQLANN